MDVNPENPDRQNIANFAQNTMRGKAFAVVKSEVDKLGSIKAQFGLEVHFKRERPDENGEMREETQRSYFYDDEPNVTTKANLEEEFENAFDNFIEEILGKIDNWSEQG